MDRLAVYLDTHWPELCPGDTVEQAIWLLEHLRRIDASGALPAIGDHGEIVHGVPLIREAIRNRQSVSVEGEDGDREGISSLSGETAPQRQIGV